MSNDHDIMRLPEPPPFSPDARDEALMQALTQFDRKNIAGPQGLPGDIRLIERTAAPLRPSRERPVMNRTRYLIAASLACVLAGSAVFLHLGRSPEPQLAAVPGEQKMASNEAVQAPVPGLDAKKEAESRIQSQFRVEQRNDNPAPAVATAPPAAEASMPAAAPAPPPPARPAIDNQVAVVAPSFAPAAPPAPSANEMMRKLAPQSPAPVRSASRSDGGLARPLPLAPTRQLAIGDFRTETQRERSPAASEPVGRDQFANAPENAFKVARDAPVSRPSPSMWIRRPTRSSAPRSIVTSCRRPASVRTEELINYFPYAYEAPVSASEPFRANVAVFPNPWSEGRKLMRIGIKGYALQQASAAARQPCVPDRYVRLDGDAEPSAAGQAVACDVAHPVAGRRPRRDRDLCGQCRHGARAHRRVRESQDTGDDRATRGAWKHGGRRRHQAGLCARRAEF